MVYYVTLSFKCMDPEYIKDLLSFDSRIENTPDITYHYADGYSSEAINVDFRVNFVLVDYCSIAIFHVNVVKIHSNEVH